MVNYQNGKIYAIKSNSGDKSSQVHHGRSIVGLHAPGGLRRAGERPEEGDAERHTYGDDAPLGCRIRSGDGRTYQQKKERTRCNSLSVSVSVSLLVWFVLCFQ